MSQLSEAGRWTRNARADNREGKMGPGPKGSYVRHHTGKGNETKIVSRAEHNRLHLRAKKSYRKRAIKKHLSAKG